MKIVPVFSCTNKLLSCGLLWRWIACSSLLTILPAPLFTLTVEHLISGFLLFPLLSTCFSFPTHLNITHFLLPRSPFSQHSLCFDIASLPCLLQLFHLTFPSVPVLSFLCSLSASVCHPLLSLCIHHASCLSFLLLMDPALSLCVCARACLRVCGGSLPCLGAGAKSTERGLDRRSVPWQNRNSIGLRRINPAGLAPSFSFCLSLLHALLLHLLGQRFQTVTHTVTQGAS